MEKYTLESEIVYSVHRQDYSKMGKALKNFEEKMPSLGVISYGVTENNLEETFKRAGGEDAAKFVLVGQREKPKKQSLRLKIHAVLYKKLLHILHSWLPLVVLLLLPIIVIIILVSLKSIRARDEAAVEITLESYKNPLITVDGSKIYLKSFLDVIGDSTVTTYESFNNDILLKVSFVACGLHCIYFQ